MNTNETNDTNNFEGKYRMLRKKFQELDHELITNKIIKYLFILVTLFLLVACVGLFIRNQALVEENKMLYADNVEFAAQIDMYMDTALYFADAAITMDEANIELKDLIAIQEEELIIYKEREELFDKYEWALIRANGTRTDITYEQIISLQEYCDEKDYSSEMVDLVLAIAMKESSGTEHAYNSSTATGYCQLLDSTAKFVYTKLEGNEKYTHDDALNGDKNLHMCADYMAYLYEYKNGSMEAAINSYRGCDDAAYKTVINKYLGKNGLSIKTIEILKKDESAMGE